MLLAPARLRPKPSQSASRSAFSTQREQDPESALMHYRARSYDPRTGRFIQNEPLEDIRWRTGYSYAENSPALRKDPLGLLSPNVVSPTFAIRRIGFVSHPMFFGPRLRRLHQWFGHNPHANNLIRLVSIKSYIKAFALTEYKLQGTEQPYTDQAFNMTVFTVGKGYIDVAHFFGNALLQYAANLLKVPALAASTATSIEWLQEALRVSIQAGESASPAALLIKHVLGDPISFVREGSESAFTIEDLPSNKLGRDLGHEMFKSGAGGQSWTDTDFMSRMTSLFRSWGAVQGDQETWRGVVQPYLRNEVGLINRLYAHWSSDIWDKLYNSNKAFEIQAQAENELGAPLPYPPRNFTAERVITPATFRFGDPSGKPRSGYGW